MVRKVISPQESASVSGAVSASISSSSRKSQPRVLNRRPKREKKISLRKIRILIKKPLFYHQHRVALIKANLTQYHKDAKNRPVHQFIDQKEEGKVQNQSLKQLLEDSSDKKKKQLKGMIETALTLKKVSLRKTWQEIYLHVCERILATKPDQVNKRSLMTKWIAKLKEYLKNELKKELKLVKSGLPNKASELELTLKQACCLLARFCHFKENVCEDICSEAN